MLVLDQFIVQLIRFEHFTASGDLRCCRQLSLTMFKLTCSWAPPSLGPLDVTHVMNASRPSPFHPSSASMYYCQHKLKGKNGVGLGTRQGYDNVCAMCGVYEHSENGMYNLCVL